MNDTLERMLRNCQAAALLLACAALGFSAAFPVEAAGADPQKLRGHIPAAIRNLAPTGELAASQQLHLAIGLPVSDPEGLTNLLRQIYDPSSPLFHHYLTPEEFAARFGARQEDYDAVAQWAMANGLSVSGRHPNRLVLDVSGSVADIERALHVRMQTYQHPKEARTFYAPSTEPSLDLTTRVLHISGLDNYTLPFPKLRKAASDAANGIAPQNGSGPGGNYMGYDFRDAYVPGTLLTGTGQSVGLLEFDGYYPNDVAQYLAQAGLPSVPLVNVSVDGYTGPPGPGNGEVSLDIDMAIAMAPGLSSVIVYSAPNNIGLWVDILSRMANDNLSKQLSCSWGGGPPNPSAEQIFLQMAAQGQSFFDAVGDSDAFVNGDIPFPGDSPNITQVGGTTLSTTGPLGSWVSEKVWNWGHGVGTCGGVSTNFAIPVWQQGVDMSTNGGSTTMRNMPDVAFTADNIYIIADNGHPQPGTGGTSCAAPLWAGFMALVNQQAAQSAQKPIGFINPTIYSICKSPLYHSTFHDIVLGDNTSPASPSQYYAVPGYDLCTGWGTPAGTNLINVLAPPLPTAFLTVVGSMVFGGNGNGVVDVNECNSFNVTLANFGGGTATSVRATLSSLTPGVFISQPTSAYADLPAGGFGTNLTPFQISSTPSFVCGTPINLMVQAKCDQSSTTNLFSIPSGLPGTNALRFDNSTPAFIPDLGETNSTVVVSNINNGLSKVTVSLYITHTFDSDLLLQLISPDGTTNTLADGDGGAGQNYGASCGNDLLRTTFDDAAATSISSGIAPFVGTFQPQTPLSVFVGKAGTNVNGAWRLRVVDQQALDVGTLQCWSLFLTPAMCVDGGGECPGADLALGMTAAPEPDLVGNALTYSISVTNNGPSTAKNVQVIQLLPEGVIFNSAVSSQGSCSQSGGIVTGTLGTMGPGSRATITVQVTPAVTGTLSSSASVSSDQPDPNPSNNSATFVSHINPLSSDLAVGLIALPNPAYLGSNITYTVWVTNNGPTAASGVTVSNVWPAGAGVLSASVSQGSITTGGLIWTVGSLGVGAWAKGTVVVVPGGAGQVSASTTVWGNQLDPVPGNNMVTVSTTVGPAADLAIGLSEYPNPAIVLSNLTYVIAVTNLGPSAASGVNVNQTLPPGVNVLTTNTAQGVVSVSGGVVTWSLGGMGVGSKATLTVVVATTGAGTLGSSATVSGVEADPNTANNVSSVSTVVSPPGVSVAAAGATLTAESFAPPNGAIDVGETVTVILRLRNSSNVATVNLVGTLLATNGVVPVGPNTPQTYGVLAPSQPPVGRSYSFTANGTNGQVISAVLALQDGATAY
ncbi:MAG TPA: protease pro-enzyme activation domain-containing protein, partial [Candidatus Acidoferrum sp.]|nr:protease pro-enzyme activation domain-containing protein [Candidatus Acidoferrum sp.]